MGIWLSGSGKGIRVRVAVKKAVKCLDGRDIPDRLPGCRSRKRSDRDEKGRPVNENGDENGSRVKHPNRPPFASPFSYTEKELAGILKMLGWECAMPVSE